MIKRVHLLAVVSVLLGSGIAGAQSSHPMVETIANHVIQKHQRASCQDIAKERSRPPEQRTDMEKRAVQIIENQSRDPRRVHQPGGGSHREQAVRVRHAAVTTKMSGPRRIASVSGQVTPRARKELAGQGWTVQESFFIGAER